MTPADKQEPVAWRIKEHDGSVRFTEQRPSDGCIRAHGYTVTPLYTRPTSDLAERIEGLAEKALNARVPGGAEVWNFLPQEDAFTPHETARDVIRCAILAALKEVNSHDRT